MYRDYVGKIKVPYISVEYHDNYEYWNAWKLIEYDYYWNWDEYKNDYYYYIDCYCTGLGMPIYVVSKHCTFHDGWCTKVLWVILTEVSKCE